MTKKTAQLDREIREALAAKRPKRPIADVIEDMNAAIKRFPAILESGAWEIAGELLELVGVHGAQFDDEILEMNDYPGVVIDLYETRRRRRVVTR